MKGLTATVILFVHAIQCQRRKFPEVINPRVALTSLVGKADGGINLCPDDHAYAFRNGDRCCKSSEDCQGNEINRSSSCCKGARATVNCPNGENCENASPPCLGLSLKIGSESYQPLKKGFSPNDDLCNEGATKQEKTFAREQLPKIRPNQRRQPQTGKKLDDKFGDTVILNYRPIFVNCESDECIWFDDNRYWRKGGCDSVGEQNSNADCSVQQDLPCPTEISCWTDSNSCKSTGIKGKIKPVASGPSCISIIICGPDFQCKVAGGNSATTGSSAASNTYQVRDGRYYSSCTWKKMPAGNWRCV